MADTPAINPALPPVIGSAIPVPTTYWKAYTTNMDVFDRPPPPADPADDQAQNG